MATAKRKKMLVYKGKPIHRVGDRIFYGNLEDRFILVLDVVEKKTENGTETASKVAVLIMDNTGKLGEGQIYRRSFRENIFKALDIGMWWLKDALDSVA